MALSLLSAILYSSWIRAHKKTDWYLGFEMHKPLNPALAFFTFIILYNNLIPISLIITLDIVKCVPPLWLSAPLTRRPACRGSTLCSRPTPASSQVFSSHRLHQQRPRHVP